MNPVGELLGAHRAELRRGSTVGRGRPRPDWLNVCTGSQMMGVWAIVIKP